MKLYLRDKENFSSAALRVYELAGVEFVDKDEADLIVVNDFRPISAGVPVACNSTGIEHIKAPEVISLRGLDLSDVTAVAELCLGMAIYLMRLTGRELRGKSVGLVGYGRIARQFENFLAPFEVSVNYFDKHPPSYALEDVLNSDVVSLHITADEENRGFFNREKFEMIKKGAIFLNSARDWLVDLEALKWALDNRLAAAWFDFELPFQHPKLLITPHLGGNTKESREKTEVLIAKFVTNSLQWRKS